MILSLLLALLAGCARTIPSDNTEEVQQTDDTSTKEEATTGTEDAITTLPPVTPEPPKFLNPLTGLMSERDLSGVRPVAIAINNITVALPSAGVSAADLLIEVPAEGGETRILLFSLDYENLGTVGSVRSARHYMLDFVEDFNAIFVHAGGSELAYEAISNRKTDKIDGVRGYAYLDVDNYFFRDAKRLSEMGYEHSLMITGSKIAAAITKLKYPTNLQSGYNFPLRFVEYDTEFLPSGENATNVVIPYLKNYRMPRLAYDADTKTYLRYHNITAPYIDSNNDAQLRFTNVIILYMQVSPIKGDDAGRLDIPAVGQGSGYYIYGGKSMPIKWKRSAQGAQISFTDSGGAPLLINRGSTYIAVAPTSISASTELSSDKGNT